jgi:hypothetical protein
MAHLRGLWALAARICHPTRQAWRLGSRPTIVLSSPMQVPTFHRTCTHTLHSFGPLTPELFFLAANSGI